MSRDNAKFKVDFKRRLYSFVLKLIKFIDHLPKGSVSDVMGRQLLRSGTSILANYVEGQAASSKKDFTNFINHSLKSSNESKVWIALLRDTKRGTIEESDGLLKELTEISNILGSIVVALKGKR